MVCGKVLSSPITEVHSYYTFTDVTLFTLSWNVLIVNIVDFSIIRATIINFQWDQFCVGRWLQWCAWSTVATISRHFSRSEVNHVHIYTHTHTHTYIYIYILAPTSISHLVLVLCRPSWSLRTHLKLKFGILNNAKMEELEFTSF